MNDNVLKLMVNSVYGKTTQDASHMIALGEMILKLAANSFYGKVVLKN